MYITKNHCENRRENHLDPHADLQSDPSTMGCVDRRTGVMFPQSLQMLDGKVTMSRVLSGLLIASVLISTTGCVNLAANLIRVVRGYDFPPEYDDLEERRVAVVCATELGICNEASSLLLSRYVRTILQVRLGEIEMVSQEDIDQWIEEQDSGDFEYVDLAKGVGADRIIVMEMTNLKLKNSSTLYQGSSDVVVTTYDAEKTNPVYQKHLTGFQYPKITGYPAINADDAKFRRIYLEQLAKTIGRYFHPYDLGEDVATDAEMLAY